MSAIFEDITAVVGYTPLVQINKLGSGKATILGKLESKNPTVSALLSSVRQGGIVWS